MNKIIEGLKNNEVLEATISKKELKEIINKIDASYKNMETLKSLFYAMKNNYTVFFWYNEANMIVWEW